MNVPGMKEALAAARLVPPINASDQYKGEKNEEGDEAVGDTFQTTKQQPLKKRPAGQAKTNLPDNKANSRKIIKGKTDKSQGCSKCRYGETGCYRCNPTKKKQYEDKQRETDHNIIRPSEN